MPTSEVYNMDCMEYMKGLPDGHFDLCIADPPYGISVTDRHRTGEKTVLVGGGGGPLEEKRLIKMRGAYSKALTHQRFIPRSTTAPRRTRRYSGSLNGSANT